MLVAITCWLEFLGLLRGDFLAVTEVRQEWTVAILDFFKVAAVLLPQLGLLELFRRALGQQRSGYLGCFTGTCPTTVQEDRDVQWNR